jgi:hypothetical protein
MAAILNPMPMQFGSLSRDARKPPIMDSTNPGTSAPQSQQFISPAASQGTTVTHVPGGRVESNGQTQQKDLHPGQHGIIVTHVEGVAVTENGEIQWKSGRGHISQAVGVVKTHSGLAENVNAASQSVRAKPMMVYAQALPLIKNFIADGHRPGGLPRNIQVK